MPTDEQSLIALAVILPLVAGLLAFWRPDGEAWHYVDLAYYPLGILGVLLFFWAAERDRQLVSAQQEFAEIQRLWRERSNVKPSIEVDDEVGEALRAGQERLLERRRLGESCRTLSDQPCLAYTGQGDAIAATLGTPDLTWDSPDPEARLRSQHIFCSAIPKLIAQMEARGLDAEAYSTVRKHLATRRSANPFVPQHDQLAADVLRRQQYWIQVTALSDRQKVKERYEAESGFALLLHEAAENCARRPAGDLAALQSLAAWRAERGRRAGIEKERRGRIASLSGQAANDGGQVRSAQLWQWPYVLIFALALKFGKAVAGVESKRRQKRRRRASLDRPDDSDAPNAPQVGAGAGPGQP